MNTSPKHARDPTQARNLHRSSRRIFLTADLGFGSTSTPFSLWHSVEDLLNVVTTPTPGLLRYIGVNSHLTNSIDVEE
jgi:hypothetical protein